MNVERRLTQYEMSTEAISISARAMPQVASVSSGFAVADRATDDIDAVEMRVRREWRRVTGLLYLPLTAFRAAAAVLDALVQAIHQ